MYNHACRFLLPNAAINTSPLPPNPQVPHRQGGRLRSKDRREAKAKAKAPLQAAVTLTKTGVMNPQRPPSVKPSRLCLN